MSARPVCTVTAVIRIVRSMSVGVIEGLNRPGFGAPSVM
jgi:hypothetical protein